MTEQRSVGAEAGDRAVGLIPQVGEKICLYTGRLGDPCTIWNTTPSVSTYSPPIPHLHPSILKPHLAGYTPTTLLLHPSQPIPPLLHPTYTNPHPHPSYTPRHPIYNAPATPYLYHTYTPPIPQLRPTYTTPMPPLHPSYTHPHLHPFPLLLKTQWFLPSHETNEPLSSAK